MRYSTISYCINVPINFSWVISSMDRKYRAVCELAGHAAKFVGLVVIKCLSSSSDPI